MIRPIAAILSMAAFLAVCSAAPASAGRISLQGARIDVEASAPRYVQKAAEDLRAQIGPFRAGAAVVSVRLSTETGALGDEGYRMASSPAGVSLTAATWRGANYALLDLVSRLAESADAQSVPAALRVQQRPDYGLRGMYAHTAWVYKYPFALRQWKLEDWKRYVDLLAYMRVNLLQIWNLISILPQPLSEEDRHYLEIFREVTRYARQERGFKAVWLGDAANDVALPSDVPIRERQFYVVHALRNPADPAGMKEIASSRETLYRVNPNADGYWIIDSDPGGWPKSPSSDFLRILQRNRSLIDLYAEKGRKAELVYWALYGWGNASRLENLRQILDGLRTSMPQRFSLLVYWPEDLRVVAAEKLLSRTVWFRYCAIEPEPSSPYTGLRFAEIRKSFEEVAGYSSLRGVMGNAQTPLLQLPDLWYYHHAAWDRRTLARNRAVVLGDLARQVFPAISAHIAAAWRLLAEDNSQAALAEAAELESAVRRHALGRPGTVGRYVTGNPAWLIENLARQLRLHAAAVQLAASLRRGDADGVRAAAKSYLDGVRSAIEDTGFEPAINKQGQNLLPFFNWYFPNRDWTTIRAALEDFRKAHPQQADRIYRDLQSSYGSRHLGPQLVEFLIGHLPVRPASFVYAN